VKCAKGHSYEDCICIDEAVARQDTRQAVVVGVALSIIICAMAGIIGVFW
jgi:hypothetical protein